MITMLILKLYMLLTYYFSDYIIYKILLLESKQVWEYSGHDGCCHLSWFMLTHDNIMIWKTSRFVSQWWYQWVWSVSLLYFTQLESIDKTSCKIYSWPFNTIYLKMSDLWKSVWLVKIEPLEVLSLCVIIWVSGGKIRIRFITLFSMHCPDNLCFFKNNA